MPEQLDEAIAHNVREKRQRRGWSKEKLADLAGVSLRTVNRLEAGNDAQVSTLIKVAEALGTSIDGLLDDRASAH